MKAFCSIHGITRGRLCTIQNSSVNTSRSPHEKHSKHGKYHKETPKEVIQLIESHIKFLRVRQSHYSLKKSPTNFCNAASWTVFVRIPVAS